MMKFLTTSFDEKGENVMTVESGHSMIKKWTLALESGY